MEQVKFIGKKEVLVSPMNREEYTKYRGWELPEDENGDDKGYLVEYVDGGKPNHADHEGYITWSPKEVFDKAYRIAESWEDKLKIEHEELVEKCDKLNAHLKATKNDVIVPGDTSVELLTAQLNAMTSYRILLSKRMYYLSQAN